MKSFYILKPDGIKRKEVLNSYESLLSKENYIKNRSRYLIDTWVDLSCLLYDPFDKKITEEEKKEIRRKMLTTIKGYDLLYQNNKAIIDIFDIPEDIYLLKRLEQIKYQIRENLVLNTPKNYLKFLNLTDHLLSQELKNINIRELTVSHIKVNHDDFFFEEDYHLACLNCIHFPDPDTKSIERDLEIIESSKILTKKIKL